MAKKGLSFKGSFKVRCKKDYTAMGQAVFRKGDIYKVNDRGTIYEIYDILGVNHLYKLEDKDSMEKFNSYFGKL